MDKRNTTKQQVNVGTIGHIDNGKSTFTEAISKYLCEKGQKSFDGYVSLYASVEKMKTEQDEAIRKQSSRNLMIKKLILLSLLSNLGKYNENAMNNSKRFYYSIKRRKRQKQCQTKGKYLLFFPC